MAQQIRRAAGVLSLELHVKVAIAPFHGETAARHADQFACLRPRRLSLAQAEPARAEARKLIGMTRGRFPVEWGNSYFDVKLQTQDARSAANLLRHEAFVASQEGNASAAVAFVRGLIGTAR